MLTYCEDHGNSFVVYEGRDCPVCKELDEKSVEIEDLKKQVEKLEEEVAANE